MLRALYAAQEKTLAEMRSSFPIAQARAAEAEQRLNAIEQSSSWRATEKLRHLFEAKPRLRRFARRSLKLVWWTVSLQLPRRYAEWRRARGAPLFGPQPKLPHAPRLTVSPTAARATASLWYDGVAPQVSIIVLNYNGSALTRACLESIWADTTGVRYEIILADNNSSIHDRSELATVDGPHHLVQIGANRQFGEGNNIAAERAKGEFLVFLNNDTEVTEGWLTAMLNTYARHQRCGAVGARLLFPDGRLQEAGAIVLPDGNARQTGRGETPDQPRHSTEKAVHYVSACSMLMRRQDFFDFGGFDYIFEPAYYEDTDLCFRLRAAGRSIIYCPEATIVHHGGVSQGNVPSIGAIIDGNRQKFVARWRAGAPQTPKPRTASHQAVNRKGPRVLLHSPYALIPGGGERYMLTIAETLSRHYRVAFAPTAAYSRLRFDGIGDALGLDLSSVELLEGITIAREYSADVFIAMGNSIVPPWENIAPRGVYHCQFPFPTDHEAIESGRRLLQRFDHVIVNSEFTRRHVLAAGRVMGVVPPVQVIYPPAPIGAQRPLPRPAGSPLRILNIGRFFSGGHCKRQDDLIRAFRLLNEQVCRPIELHLAGATHGEAEHQRYLARCRELAQGLPVFFHLNAQHDDLERLTSTADLYWHGTGLGVDRVAEPSALEHFGIAIAEAMGRGLLTFAVDAGGPAEIIDHGVTGYLFRDVEDLVVQSLSAIASWETEAVQAVRNRGSASAARFAPDVFSAAWTHLVDSLLARDGHDIPDLGPALKL